MTGREVLHRRMAAALAAREFHHADLAAQVDNSAGSNSCRDSWLKNWNSRSSNKSKSPSLKKRRRPSSRRFLHPRRGRLYRRLASSAPIRAVPVAAGLVRAMHDAVRGEDLMAQRTDRLMFAQE